MSTRPGGRCVPLSLVSSMLKLLVDNWRDSPQMASLFHTSLFKISCKNLQDVSNSAFHTLRLNYISAYVEVGENFGSTVRAWIIMCYFNYYVIIYEHSIDGNPSKFLK